MYKALHFLLSIVFIFSNLALAEISRGTAPGAVSGGGGGTTTPEPSNPIWVSEYIRSYAGPILKMYFNKEESYFKNLSDSEKSESPYLKLYSDTDKNIFKILETVKIEIRTSEPCYDIDGTATDGSIYAAQPDAICISAYRIASKVNSRYLATETLALVVHELSHLSGVTEDEARAIQEGFVSINSSQMLDAKVKLKLLAEAFPAGQLGEPILGLKYWISVPAEATYTELNQWSEQLVNLRNYEMQMGSVDLQVLRHDSLVLFIPFVVKLRVVREYACVHNLSEDKQLREFCADRLNRGFESDQLVSVMTYQTRNGYTSLGDEYSKVMLRKINSLSDVSIELADIQTYLQSIHSEIKQLVGFQFPIYLK